jgi:hypothetical protein
MHKQSKSRGWIVRAILTLGLITAIGFDSLLITPAQRDRSVPARRDIPSALAELGIDNSLRALIDSRTPRRYRTYSFVAAGRTGDVRMRFWSGLLLMPDPTIDGAPIPVRFAQDGRRYEDWWYRNAAKTRLTKFITDSRRRIVGLLSLEADGGVAASIDLNGDRVIDVMQAIRPTTRGIEESLAITDDMGAAFYDRWLRGTNPLCGGSTRETEDGAGLTFDRSPDRRASLPGCSSSSGGTIPSYRGGSAKGETPEDPADVLCAGRNKSPRPSIGGGIRNDDHLASRVANWWGRTLMRGFDGERDSSGVILIRILASVFSMTLPASIIWAWGYDEITHQPVLEAAGAIESADESIDETAARIANGNRARTGSNSNSGGSNSNAATNSNSNSRGGNSNSNSGRGGGNANSGGGNANSNTGGRRTNPGPTGGDPLGPDSEAALDKLCADRAASNERWRRTHSLKELDQFAADSECTKPVEGREARSTGAAKPRLCRHDDQQDRSNYQDLQELLSAAGSGCSNTERPGPDGRCGNRRRVTVNRGAAAVAYGGIIGFEPCDPRVCDPTPH